MRSLEFVSCASAHFDKYAVVMGAFVEPEFLDLDMTDPIASSSQLKGIAIASLAQIVRMRVGEGLNKDTLYRNTASAYYRSEASRRLPHRVRSYRPNALAHNALVGKLLKSRLGRIQLNELLDGMPACKEFDAAIAHDKDEVMENIARENGRTLIR